MTANTTPRWISDKFDELSAEIFVKLGEYVPAWDSIEKEIAKTYLIVMQSKDPLIPLAGLTAVINFQGRLAVVDSAAKQGLNSIQYGRWTKQMAKIVSVSRTRNRLVHSELTGKKHEDKMLCGLMPSDIQADKFASVRDFKNNSYNAPKIQLAIDDLYRTLNATKEMNSALSTELNYQILDEISVLYRFLRR